MKTSLFAILLLCSQTVFSQIHTEEELIRKVRLSSNEAIARQDVDAIASYWLDDYVVIRGSGTVEQGKKANKTNWRKLFKENPRTRFERFPIEISISKNNPDLAWESGEWKGFNTYSTGGRYSAQWKKKSGQWKLQAELFVALEK